MNCYVAGLIGLGLAGGSWMTMTTSDAETTDLMKTLSPDLASKYNEIVTERRNIYMQGLTLGTVAAYFAQKTVRSDNLFHRVAVFLTVTLLISLMYYTVTPKSDYMLKHFKTPEET